MVFQYFFGVGAGLTLGFALVALPSWMVWQKAKQKIRERDASWASRTPRKAGA